MLAISGKFGLAQLSMLLDGTEDADIGAIKTKFFHELKLSPHILVPWKQQASVFCIEVFLGHARRACARFCDTVWNKRVGHRLPRVFSVCWNPWLPVFMHPRTLAAPSQPRARISSKPFLSASNGCFGKSRSRS
jgi:hypothetical protein